MGYSSDNNTDDFVAEQHRPCTLAKKIQKLKYP